MRAAGSAREGARARAAEARRGYGGEGDAGGCDARGRDLVLKAAVAQLAASPAAPAVDRAGRCEAAGEGVARGDRGEGRHGASAADGARVAEVRGRGAAEAELPGCSRAPAVQSRRRRGRGRGGGGGGGEKGNRSPDAKHFFDFDYGSAERDRPSKRARTPARVDFALKRPADRAVTSRAPLERVKQH